MGLTGGEFIAQYLISEEIPHVLGIPGDGEDGHSQVGGLLRNHARLQSGAQGVIPGPYNGPDGLFDDRIEVQASKAMTEVPGCEVLFEDSLEGETR